MPRTCIAVVDATRARLFIYERISDPSGDREQLEEQVDLVNLARRRRGSELFSEARPGLSRQGGLQYGYDDHRSGHLDELDAELARSAADEITKLVRKAGVSRVILCASPNMLGHLRDHVKLDEVRVDELARDYVKLTPPQLREHLVKHGLLPAPPPRPGVTSPPGH